MAKMVFKVDGGGDMSVGIQDTHATAICRQMVTGSCYVSGGVEL